MLDITTIILTYNEEKHIKRCLENVLRFSKKVYVVDSPSTDRTQELCNLYENVEVVVHKYPGNQAAQFNWALENLKIETEWILRLDADEYLSDDLIKEMEEKIPSLDSKYTGIVLKRDVIFMGKRIRFGKLKPVKLLRIWRNGKGMIENRLMDEHTILTEGVSVEFNNYFYDNNINGIDVWTNKHLDYANREVKVALGNQDLSKDQITLKRDSSKSKYYSLPMFFRGVLFFILRYIFLGGFLDGKAGFVWHLLQCLWYRTIVDIKIESYKERI